MQCSLEPEKCRYLGTQENVLRWAILNGESLSHCDFKRGINIEHMDGSKYSFSSACINILDQFLIVYPEHGHPFVFYKDDLQHYPGALNVE